MILLPILFAIIFVLALALKLLGGHFGWWVIIVLGALVLIPAAILVILEVYYRK